MFGTRKKPSEIVRRFFNTDLSYLANSGKWLVLSQIINVILSVALAAAFANLLTPETYGTYKFFITLIGFFTIFSLQGMGTALVRTVSRGTETNIYEALKTKLLWSLLGSLAAMATAIYYFIQGDEYFGWTIAAISLTIPLFGSLGIFQPYLTGKKQFKTVARNSALIKIISTALLVTTILLIQEVWVLVLAYILFTIFLNGFSLYFTLKRFPPHDTTVDRNLSDGKHLSFMGGIGVAAGTLQNIALWHFIGPVGLAVFALAAAPIEQIRPFIKLTENIFLPKLAQDSWQTGNIKWLIKKLTPFALIITGMIVVYILLIPYAYRLIFPLYLESILYSQILAIGLLFTALSIVTNTIIKAKKDISSMYVLNITDICFNLFVSLPCVYLFGILGLVFAIILKKCITFIVSLYLIFNQAEETTQDYQS